MRRRRGSLLLLRHLMPSAWMLDKVRREIDPQFYLSCYSSVMGGAGNAAEHFIKVGAHRGYLPNAKFDPLVYSMRTGVEPADALLHCLKSSGVTCETGEDWMPPAPPIDLHGLGAEGGLALMQPDEVAANRDAAPNFGKAASTTLRGPTKSFQIVAPSADDFLEDFASCRPQTFAKLPHGFWDAKRLLEALACTISTVPESGRFSCEQRRLLAQRWAQRLYPWYGAMSEHFINDVEQVLNEVPSITGLRVGVSFKGFPTHDERVWHTPTGGEEELRSRIADLEGHFTDGTEFLDGTAFKRWAISGDLQHFAALLRERRVILVASEPFADLGDRLGLPTFEWVRIQPSNSQVHRHAILQECRIRLMRRSTIQTSPVLLTQAGGSLSFWLLIQLAQEFPEATLFDMGQSLNIWALDRCQPNNWLRIYIREIVANGGLETYYRDRGGTDFIERFRL